MESNLTPMPESVAASVESTPPASIWSIIGNVFMAPTKAFVDFARKPVILIPLVIVIIVAGGAAFFTAEYDGQIGYDMMKTSTTLPAQVLEQMRQDSENPNAIKSLLLGGLPIIIMTLFSALLAWAIGSFVMGARSSFKAVWGVGLMSSLIVIVGAMLRVPLVLAKESPYVTLGLAALFPEKNFTSMLYMFLFMADVFAIWSLVVAGLGYSQIFRVSEREDMTVPLSAGKGMAISVITFLVLSWAAIGLQAFGTSFAGVEVSFW